MGELRGNSTTLKDWENLFMACYQNSVLKAHNEIGVYLVEDTNLVELQILYNLPTIFFRTRPDVMLAQKAADARARIVRNNFAIAWSSSRDNFENAAKNSSDIILPVTGY
jgi:hypothetical protein